MKNSMYVFMLMCPMFIATRHSNVVEQKNEKKASVIENDNNYNPWIDDFTLIEQKDIQECKDEWEEIPLSAETQPKKQMPAYIKRLQEVDESHDMHLYVSFLMKQSNVPITIEKRKAYISQTLGEIIDDYSVSGDDYMPFRWVNIPHHIVEKTIRLIDMTYDLASFSHEKTVDIYKYMQSISNADEVYTNLLDAFKGIPESDVENYYRLTSFLDVPALHYIFKDWLKKKHEAQERNNSTIQLAKQSLASQNKENYLDWCKAMQTRNNTFPTKKSDGNEQKMISPAGVEDCTDGIEYYASQI